MHHARHRVELTGMRLSGSNEAIRRVRLDQVGSG